MTRKPFSVEKGFIIIWQTSSISFFARHFKLIPAIIEKVSGVNNKIYTYFSPYK
jgi:hypothetical protein